jgi:hypothetical protein
MEERIAGQDPRAGERRRRWPGPCPDEERRADALPFETDQEPDQSPLVTPGTTPPPG